MGVRPILCINKIDLVDPAELQPIIGVYGQMGYEVMCASATCGLPLRFSQLSSYEVQRSAPKNGSVPPTMLQVVLPGWSPTQYVPLLNPFMLDGLALAASILAIYRLRRPRIDALLSRSDANVGRDQRLCLGNGGVECDHLRRIFPPPLSRILLTIKGLVYFLHRNVVM